MSRYFAETGPDRAVLRVVVCDDPAWLTERLGGTWVETADPYTTEAGDVWYCGPGWGYDPTFPQQFAPQWVQPQGADVEGYEPYPAGTVVYHQGHLWTSTVETNVWEPGVAAWRQVPTIPGVPPPWQQPSGSADAYRIIDGTPEMVTHNGKTWVTLVDANVWEPGTDGTLWAEVTDEPAVDAWVQPTGGHDAYPAGAQVTHNGRTWENTHGDGNVWEPGVFGWTDLGPA